MEKVAIQGFSASFHEAAAEKFYGDDISMYQCISFPKLFDVMERRQADKAIMAIENSVAGSILPNYARLRAASLSIVGEIYLRIEMNMMALSGQSIQDIKEVHSHPIALLQCQQFFRNHPHIRIVESDDTALSAKEIADQQIKGRAALASKQAAGLYGLEILASSVETNKRNFTRFLALKNESEVQNLDSTAINKASWSFRTAHSSGSLAKVLTILGHHNINLTKIQSLPVLGEEWNYYFYADLEFAQIKGYQQAKLDTKKYLHDLKILGEYKSGNTYL